MNVYDRIHRYLAWANQSIDRYQRVAGTTVQWFEFDPSTSVKDPLYDEGQRRYLPAKALRVLGMRFTEGEEVTHHEGLLVLDRIHLVLSVRQVTQDGLSDPTNSLVHIKDRFVWNDRTWDVRTYHAEERVRELVVTLGVDAVQVYDDEMVNDPQFATG